MAKKAYIGVLTPQSSLSAVSVGDTVKINENGVPVDYLVVQQGLPSSKYDSSCDGTWVLRKDCYQSPVAWDSDNAGNYENSDIHQYLNGTFLGLFDGNVQASIKQVKIPYTKGTSTAVSGANGLSAKAFLLCGQEINVTATDGSALKEDASVLAYFVNAGNAERIAYMDGKAQYWALRTPYPANTAYICRVRDIGDVQGYQSAYQYIIRPAFILPSNLSLTNGVVTGAQAELVSVARKVKKGYLGIDGIARKIKKAYIGIGGVARPCWSGGELAYYGEITPLTAARWNLAATSNGSYALFGGGHISGTSPGSKVVDAYNASLVRTTATELDYNVAYLAAASIGNYSIFAGGVGGNTTRANAYAYDLSLTKQNVTSLSLGVFSLAATNNANYALFGGGSYSNSAQKCRLTAYDRSLTRSNFDIHNYGTTAATNVGNYALFGGGHQGSSYLSAVSSVDDSLTQGTPTQLSVARNWLQAARAGNYALFAGGYNNKVSDVVDAYDTSLTRSTPTALSVARRFMSATSIEDYAVFAGGGAKNVVDVYDASLTRTTNITLNIARSYPAATTLGNYALCGGGMTSETTVFTSVEAFTVA